jgi:hypothetical protein
MTMHIERAWLSTTGKSKVKKKWASAEQKRQHEQLTSDWSSIKSKWGVVEQPKKKTNQVVDLPTTAKMYVRETKKVPSLNSWTTGVVSSKPSPQYTGTSILGIGTLHKSNAVPIFTNQEAEDIAKMRR